MNGLELRYLAVLIWKVESVRGRRERAGNTVAVPTLAVTQEMITII